MNIKYRIKKYGDFIYRWYKNPEKVYSTLVIVAFMYVIFVMILVGISEFSPKHSYYSY